MKNWKLFLISVAVAGSGFLLISWREKAANLAAKFIDIAEVGTNAGFSNATFERMMKEVGWKGGEAWCMYFAKSIYLNAFKNKSLEIVRILTGSTQQSWKNAMANPDVFNVITDGPPQKGDIAIWQSTTNPANGHAGIVYKKQKGRTWYMIEGNTSQEKAREGDVIAKQSRLLVPGTIEGNLKLLGFLRLKTNLF